MQASFHYDTLYYSIKLMYLSPSQNICALIWVVTIVLMTMTEHLVNKMISEM